MKVLLTGGSGFIGMNLQGYLKDKGYELVAPSSHKLNVLKSDDLKKWDDKMIEHVVHLAGKTFVPESWNEPKKYFEINMVGTLNVLEFCRRNNISMTYISAYVYGIPERNPICEIAPANPNNPYAKSKYISEELCEFYCRHFNMDISVLRIFNVYGPGQNSKFLIPSIIEQTLDANSNIVVQDLVPKRDYVFIDDVSRAIELSICKTCGYHLFNVGSGFSYSVKEIIEIIQKQANTNKKVISKQNVRQNEVEDVIANISKIDKEWNWNPQIDIEVGLKKCIEEARYGKLYTD